MSQRTIVYALACAGLLSLAGCSSITSVLDPSQIDYKSAGKANTQSLDVPPDLTQMQRDNRYTVPNANNGTVTASTYQLQQETAKTASNTNVVAQNTLQGMHIERDGNQHWLVVNQTPEALWPQIKDFWQESGFLINVDLPAEGVMETDWAENRSKIPQDIVRDLLGKVIDSAYDSGERDKFRTRLERRADGVTEIYISHRGAHEVFTSPEKDTTSWVPRPSDPGLEVTFLTRMMTRLGADSVAAKAAAASNSTVLQPHARLVQIDGGSAVQVDESFDRAWRRVGLALDRVGFTVEDRDRSQGLYFVRYVDQVQDTKTKSGEEKGWFSKLFSSSDDKVKAAQRYRILVKGAGDISNVSVLNKDGKRDTSDVSGKILALLNEQLR